MVGAKGATVVLQPATHAQVKGTSQIGFHLAHLLASPSSVRIGRRAQCKEPNLTPYQIHRHAGAKWVETPASLTNTTTRWPPQKNWYE